MGSPHPSCRPGAEASHPCWPAPWGPQAGLPGRRDTGRTGLGHQPSQFTLEVQLLLLQALILGPAGHRGLRPGLTWLPHRRLLGQAPGPGLRDAHLYISSDSSLSSSCFSWMSWNQSTMRPSSVSSGDRSWLHTEGLPAPSPRPAQGVSVWFRSQGQDIPQGRAGRQGGTQEGRGPLTSLCCPQTLFQLHAPELQGIQLPLDVLHLPLDLLLGDVVRVQLGTEGGRGTVGCS